MAIKMMLAGLLVVVIGVLIPGIPEGWGGPDVLTDADSCNRLVDRLLPSLERFELISFSDSGFDPNEIYRSANHGDDFTIPAGVTGSTRIEPNLPVPFPLRLDSGFQIDLDGRKFEPSGSGKAPIAMRGSTAGNGNSLAALFIQKNRGRVNTTGAFVVQ